MKTFNHCDENFLSLDSAQKTCLLCMAEKVFLQMGKMTFFFSTQISH